MLIYGKHPVLEAIRTGRKLKNVYVIQGSSSEKLLSELGIKYAYMSRGRMEQLCGEDHQGICAYLDEDVILPSERNLQDFLSRSKGIMLVLYRIQDQRNLGSIVRSAYLLGVEHIISTFKHSAKVNATTIKASAGALFHVNFSYMDNLRRLMDILETERITTFALERGGTYVEHTSFPDRFVLFVGSEHYGIPEHLLKRVQGIVSLRQRVSSINSYNVANALSIALYIATLKFP